MTEWEEYPRYVSPEGVSCLVFLLLFSKCQLRFYILLFFGRLVYMFPFSDIFGKHEFSDLFFLCLL